MSNYKFKELKKVPKSAGIYSICNLLNNKRYIGSTNNFYNRFHEHKCLLRNNKHHSLHLQNAFNKYGEGAFVFQILEVCEPVRDTLLYIEQKYLDLKPEYNINKYSNGADIGFNKTRSDKYHRVEVQGLDPITKQIVVTFPSIVCANKFYKKAIYNPAILDSINSYSRHAYLNLIWKFSDQDIELFQNNYRKRKRKVAKYTLNGDLICVYESVKEAQQSIGQRKNFARDIIKNNYKWKGFLWKYLD